MNADDPRFAGLIQHLMLDFANQADGDHLRELVLEVLEAGEREAYLAITAVSSITATVVRAAFADQIAAVVAGTAEPFWGLEAVPKPGVDVNEPRIRCAIAAAQTMTAALNEDRDTAAAVVMAIVRDPDRGAEDSAHLLIATLRIFSQIYNSPEGRAGWDAIREARRG